MSIYGKGNYCNEFDPSKNPTIGEFKRLFLKYAEDITDGNGEMVSNHNLSANVSVECENDDATYSIVALEVEQLVGCGCASGIRILIKRD